MMKRQLVSALAVSIALASGFSHAAFSASQPNIILMLADDMGWADISSQGGKTPTPNLDMMAKEGQRWTQFYVASPVCSPSRGSLLTGRVETKTGLYGSTVPVFFESDPDGFPDEEVSLAESLRDGGYRTIMFGKWHLGSQPDGLPTRHGFDQWYGIPTSNDLWHTTAPDFKTLLSAKNPASPEAFANARKIQMQQMAVPDQKYWDVPLYDSYRQKGRYVDYQVPGGLRQKDFTQDITARAVDYINEQSEKPFFMYMAWPQNHVPIFTSDAFIGKGHNRYGDAMAEVDWSVGQINNALKARGLDKNTIVIFTSDNGPWLPFDKWGLSGSAVPLRDGKSSVFEGGQRTPFIIKWPGKIVPAVKSGLGSTLDILPTLMSLSHTEHAQKDLDGVDLSPALFGDTNSPRTSVPYFFMGELMAWREGDYKIVLNALKDGKPAPLAAPLLYNVTKDVSEEQDLAAAEPVRIKNMKLNAQRYVASLGEKKAPLFDMD